MCRPARHIDASVDGTPAPLSTCIASWCTEWHCPSPHLSRLSPLPSTRCLRPGVLTDSAMQTFILRRVRASTVLLAPFEKLQRKLLKAALGLFGSADNAPRVQVRRWPWLVLVALAGLPLPLQLAKGVASPGHYLVSHSPLRLLPSLLAPQAILLVRQMALELPQPALDNCLKVGAGS